MADHLAILKRPYVQMILAGRKTVESRLTRHARPPYRRTSQGDRIFFKCSSGPVMAAALAGRVWYFDSLDPTTIDRLRDQFGEAVGADDAYWRLKRDSRYATFIELTDVRPETTGPPIGPSQGVAWFTLDDPIQPGCLEVTLTEGAIRNHYLRLAAGRWQADGNPQNPLGPGLPVTLLLPDGRRVQTQVNHNRMIRWRGWGSYYHKHQLGPGDKVCLELSQTDRIGVRFTKNPNPCPAPTGTTTIA